MPCHDSRNDPEYVRKEALKESASLATDLRNRCDMLTRIACEMGRNLKSFADLSEESTTWLREHIDFDAKRSG